ncbi:hypothetical protein HK102_008773, partial [Quaeritorhiza haematococci]
MAPTLAIAAALLGAVLAAFAYILVRKVGKRAHYLVHVTWFGLISTILSGFVTYTFEKPVPVLEWTGKQWMYLVGMGLSAFMAQACLNAGLQLANAGPATLMRNLDIVFAFVYGILIFDETPHPLSIIGATLILGATGGIA